MMRVLSTSAFMCAMMFLTNVVALPEAKSDDDETAKRDLVKRSTVCSHGWTGFNGRCFRYIPTPMSWANAEKRCQSMKGNLASIHDIEEYHEIQRVVMTATHELSVTWVGGSDAQEENQWLWTDGTSFQFKNWCPGEPNNIHQQHCLTINYGGQKCWDDNQCRYKRPFLCAKKA